MIATVSTLPIETSTTDANEIIEPTWETALYEEALLIRTTAEALGLIYETTAAEEASTNQTAPISERMKSALALVMKHLLILRRWAHTVDKLDELKDCLDVILSRWAEIVRLHDIAQTLEVADKDRVENCGAAINVLRWRIEKILRSEIRYRGLKSFEITTMTNFKQLAVPNVIIEPARSSAGENVAPPPLTSQTLSASTLGGLATKAVASLARGQRRQGKRKKNK
jgi:hypothetical protein